MKQSGPLANIFNTPLLIPLTIFNSNYVTGQWIILVYTKYLQAENHTELCNRFSYRVSILLSWTHQHLTNVLMLINRNNATHQINWTLTICWLRKNASQYLYICRIGIMGFGLCHSIVGCAYIQLYILMIYIWFINTSLFTTFYISKSVILQTSKFVFK